MDNYKFSFIFSENKIKYINVLYNDNESKMIEDFDKDILLDEPYTYCIKKDGRYNLTIILADKITGNEIMNGKVVITIGRFGTDFDGVMYRSGDGAEKPFRHEKVTIAINDGAVSEEFGMVNVVEAPSAQRAAADQIELNTLDLLRNVKADLGILEYYAALDTDGAIRKILTDAYNALSVNSSYPAEGIAAAERQLAELFLNDRNSAEASN